ncbi:hypothetical protein PR048_024252 [Dryococelus australis]|uniref:Integrase zinc-binding domain-containing protein n=1 Tax=Dryococelus australis TaxID=614101 RepID=A0ABQ9GN21_9NEOP|nr:hypothetical protein PR048_024252 [Dryococelus australis]
MGDLSAGEISVAEMTLVRVVQSEVLRQNKSTNLKTLCVFEDSEHILRVGTNITLREDKEDFRHPMILPSDKLIRDLILEEHKKITHARVHVLLSKLRERFWILRWWRIIRNVLSKCVKCRIYEARGIPSACVLLPEYRVRDASAFEVIDVHIAGPLILRNGCKIQWRFNPLTATWWGGWWERLVQIVKELLRHTLGKASLSYEEVLSVLCDVAAAINPRPLTYVSDDPEDLIPLTPAMFIQDLQMVGVGDLDSLDLFNLFNRYRYLERLHNILGKDSERSI